MKVAAIFHKDTGGATVRIHQNRRDFYNDRSHQYECEHTGFIGEVCFPKQERCGSRVTMEEVMGLICGVTEHNSTDLVRNAIAKTMDVATDRIVLTHVRTKYFSEYYDASF